MRLRSLMPTAFGANEQGEKPNHRAMIRNTEPHHLDFEHTVFDWFNVNWSGWETASKLAKSGNRCALKP
jgi:hypothetical protein